MKLSRKAGPREARSLDRRRWRLILVQFGLGMFVNQKRHRRAAHHRLAIQDELASSSPSCGSRFLFIARCLSLQFGLLNRLLKAGKVASIVAARMRTGTAKGEAGVPQHGVGLLLVVVGSLGE